jgi:hypothetical protein
MTSMTNTTNLDAQSSWFFKYFKIAVNGEGDTMDPLMVLGERFPDVDRRLLRDLCEDLRAMGRWVRREIPILRVRKEIPASDWQGGY